MFLTLIPRPTVAEVLHLTLPAMTHLSGKARATPRQIAYALAYDRRLMREIDADRTTLNRPASAALICLSSRLIDVSVTLAMQGLEPC